MTPQPEVLSGALVPIARSQDGPRSAGHRLSLDWPLWELAVHILIIALSLLGFCLVVGLCLFNLFQDWMERNEEGATRR
jgi:hypothetical protein